MPRLYFTKLFFSVMLFLSITLAVCMALKGRLPHRYFTVPPENSVARLYNFKDTTKIPELLPGLAQRYTKTLLNLGTFASDPTLMAYNIGDIRTAQELSNIYASYDYCIDKVRSGESVPRIYFGSLPSGFHVLQETNDHRNAFLQLVLPVILLANEEITATRQRIIHLQKKVRLGQQISDQERSWLEEIASYYKEKSIDFDRLLVKVDKIPVSLALATSVLESGWGTSTLAQNKNALFGQRVYRDQSRKKRQRGEAMKLKSFNTLFECVRAYIHNINTHLAYQEFRQARFQMRRYKKPLDSMALADHLIKYSELGKPYVKKLKSIIEGNALKTLDEATLADMTPARGSQETGNV